MEEHNNITPHQHDVNAELRNKHKRHRALVVWFTGFSGSGKSTIANRSEQLLFSKGVHTYLLDGDNIRTGLNKGLGFSEADRAENIRRIAEVCKLFVDAGVLVLSAFVSPLKKDRELVKQIIGKENFVEVYVSTSLAECERRDVKGLYKKAREGKIPDFTGISAPYEKPESPCIEINTEKTTIDEAANLVLDYLTNTVKIQL